MLFDMDCPLFPEDRESRNKTVIVKVGLKWWAKWALFAGVLLDSRRIVDVALKHGVWVK